MGLSPRPAPLLPSTPTYTHGARWADLEVIKFEFENQKRLETEKLQVYAVYAHAASMHFSTPDPNERLWQLIVELKEIAAEEIGQATFDIGADDSSANKINRTSGASTAGPVNLVC